MSRPDIAQSSVQTLLLGGGYTLSRVALLLPPTSFLVTTRTDTSCSALQAQGLPACSLDLSNLAEVVEVLETTPQLQCIVDGVPPAEGMAAEELYETTKIRAHHFLKRKIRRILYLSTTGVFGTSDGSWVDASTVAAPRFKRGKARLAVETGYREILGEAFTSIRIPAIYGTGRGIGTAIKAARYKLIDSGTRWTNRIEVSDLARAIVTAINSPNLPSILCLSDGTPAQACEVVDFYCSQFNLPVPKSISEEEAFAAGLETMLSNQRIDPSKSWTALGILPLVKSFREGARIEMTVDP